MPSEKSVRIFAVAAVVATCLVAGIGAYYFKTRRAPAPAKKTPRKGARKSRTVAVPSPSSELQAASVGGVDNEKRIREASSARSRGNKYYNGGKYDAAIKCYTEAVELYPAGHQELALAYGNRAACYLIQTDFDAVIEDCDRGQPLCLLAKTNAPKALQIDSRFVKALDRRGKAYESKEMYDEALADVTAACIIDDFKTGQLVERIDVLLQKMSEKAAHADFEVGRVNVHGSPTNALQVKKPTLPVETPLMEEFFSTFPNLLKNVPKQSREALDKAVSTHSSSAKARLDRGVSSIMEKDYISAVDDFEQAVRLAKTPEERAMAHAWHGSFLFLKGDMKSAQDSLAKSLELDPLNSDTIIKLALTHLELNEFNEMNTLLDAALAAGPSNPAVYYHRGEIQALGSKLEEASSSFAKCIELEPNMTIAYVHMARALLGLGRLDQARALLNKGLALLPKDSELLNCLGEVMVLERQFDQAEAQFNSILEREPNNASVHLNKALLAMGKSGDHKAAEQSLRQALKASPTFESAHLQLANLLLSDGRHSEAEEHFDAAVEHARTFQELVAVHSCRAAGLAQIKIAERYPELVEKMKYPMSYL